MASNAGSQVLNPNHNAKHGQRSVGLPNENGTTFSLTGPTSRNDSYHFFIPFLNSLISAKKQFVKNGTANFDQSVPTQISGPPPEVIPNIPVRTNLSI